MDFSIPSDIREDMRRFSSFLTEHLEPEASRWYRAGEIPRKFFQTMAEQGWFGYKTTDDGGLEKMSTLRKALSMEKMARISPGVAVAVLVHTDLGLSGLWLFGSKKLRKKYGPRALSGQRLMCLGNTESMAGSDVASIRTRAEKVADGWKLDGVKAYVTGADIADLAVVTAVTDPEEHRNKRMSMFLVDLNSEGVSRKKLDKQVWIPSDLTRIRLDNVIVPDSHLMGRRKRGLQQVLTIFTHSRVPISALTLGTARGAFDLALSHGKKREVFGEKILDFQAKAFEAADFYARMEAARMMMLKACWKADQGEDFRASSSMAKYLSVMVAREITQWAADLFGAASVMFDHPIHKFPMDAWASSLGEGTQDIQKLVIFRHLIRQFKNKPDIH